MNDGRPKLFIDKKFVMYMIAFVIMVLAVLYFIRKPQPVYQNCSQIKLETGRAYIKKGDPLYQERLDWNKNGYSCE